MEENKREIEWEKTDRQTDRQREKDRVGEKRMPNKGREKNSMRR